MTKCFNTPLCKIGRIESPWHNAAGLPTQVPMRSWTANNAFTGSLQQQHQQSSSSLSSEQQAINMTSTSSFITSTNNATTGISGNPLLPSDILVEDPGILAAPTSTSTPTSTTVMNNCNLSKLKLNNLSQAININHACLSSLTNNNYLKVHPADHNIMTNDLRSDHIQSCTNDNSSTNRLLLSSFNHDCLCPTEFMNDVNMITNFPIDSPASQSSAEFDRRTFLNEESSARSLLHNTSDRNLNGLSDSSEQLRSIVDSTTYTQQHQHHNRSTNETSTNRISFSSPASSSVNSLDISSSNITRNFLSTPINNSYSASNCLTPSIEGTKYSRSSSSDNTGLLSSSELSVGGAVDRFISSNPSAASALYSFLGLGSTGSGQVNSSLCCPSTTPIFQSNLLSSISQAAVAALLLQHSRTASSLPVYPTASNSSLPLNCTNNPNSPVILTSSSSAGGAAQFHNPVDVVNQTSGTDKSFNNNNNQVTQSIATAFSTSHHQYNNNNTTTPSASSSGSEFINSSFNLCDQQLNLLKQLPRFLIGSSGVGTTSPPPPAPPPTTTTAASGIDNLSQLPTHHQSAAQSLRQLANALFWSSLGSKAIDLLSTFESDLLQQQHQASQQQHQSPQQLQQQQHQQSINPLNCSNPHFSHHHSTVSHSSVSTTVSRIVSNNPINSKGYQVNNSREDSESINKTYHHHSSLSSTATATTTLLNSENLLKDQLLLPLHSSYPNSNNNNTNMSAHVEGLINFINKSPTPFHGK
ncbi:unnamed protein product [Trichobilharzia szidati]|nr:unnamed protein product [Trichobilharzia szidati]